MKPPSLTVYSPFVELAAFMGESGGMKDYVEMGRKAGDTDSHLEEPS